MKPTMREIVKVIYNAFGGKLRFISGKWFWDGEKKYEIKNLYKFLDKWEDDYDYSMWFDFCSSPSQFNDFQDIFIKLYGESGEWLPLQIIEDAKKTPPTLPLAFPFEPEQMMLINYLLRHNEEKCIILTGVGGSGKSTFGNIIQQIFDSDVGHASLEDLSNPFCLEEAVKHRLIYSDELNSDELNNGVLKRLFSNQKIQVQAKGRDPYETKCQSAFLFCCNTPPRIDLEDTGILRRIVYYSMNHKIRNPNPDFNHKEYTYDQLRDIVCIALQMPMENWDKAFRDDSRYNLLKNNSVYILRDCRSYSEYRTECSEKGLKPYSEPKWDNITRLIKEWKAESEFDPFEGLCNGLPKDSFCKMR